mmetsp:Transcript_39322/g.99112  ORF Transcript_39322/g.99112 Transcript_39322/m.99112 type:complete len:217 (-) Transcript_39322:567-1217(-)
MKGVSAEKVLSGQVERCHACGALAELEDTSAARQLIQFHLHAAQILVEVAHFILEVLIVSVLLLQLLQEEGSDVVDRHGRMCGQHVQQHDRRDGAILVHVLHSLVQLRNAGARVRSAAELEGRHPQRGILAAEAPTAGHHIVGTLALYGVEEHIIVATHTHIHQEYAALEQVALAEQERLLVVKVRARRLEQAAGNRLPFGPRGGQVTRSLHREGR